MSATSSTSSGGDFAQRPVTCEPGTRSVVAKREPVFRASCESNSSSLFLAIEQSSSIASPIWDLEDLLLAPVMGGKTMNRCEQTKLRLPKRFNESSSRSTSRVPS